jgi:NADH dehydrogenase/NADH:ubiquinone oxidoreductase subunit G
MDNTVTIVNPLNSDYLLIIWAHEYDPSKHTLWSDRDENQTAKVKTEINAEAETEATLTDLDRRNVELNLIYYGESGEEKNWRAIKAIADSYGISKPHDGWDAAIPLILEIEFGST